MPRNKSNTFKSEYSNSYKIYKEKAEAEYSENFKLRLARRSHEVTHQPWAWLDINSSDEEIIGTDVSKDSLSSVREELVQVNSTALHKEGRHNGYNSDDTNSNFDASGTVDIDRNNNQCDMLERLKKKALEKAAEMRRSNSENLITTGSKQHERSTSTQTSQRPAHPTKGSAKLKDVSDKFTPRPSTATPQASRSLAHVNRSNNFISYGFGSDAGTNNHKKTFNVSSRVDVHPSAARALQRRELERQRRLQQELRQRDRKQHEEAVRQQQGSPGLRFVGRGRPRVGRCRSACSPAGQTDTKIRPASKGRPSSPDWMSEYQRRFPIYDYDTYRRCRANIAERGLSARQDTPRTCRI